ncbi:hypothetical protein EVAR_80487_1 [Eumeta japonica]|uniref:Uncharacterized protein n=1 Tax=Eumeta variegata TaxID=151549 RepID=A0A4C1ZHW2_EUMVA|nr:hypothetical protein EVAR_80487_1 [Eumeta japonica]
MGNNKDDPPAGRPVSKAENMLDNGGVKVASIAERTFQATDTSAVIKTIVTGDETRVFQYDPESKQESCSSSSITQRHVRGTPHLLISRNKVNAGEPLVKTQRGTEFKLVKEREIGGWRRRIAGALTAHSATAQRGLVPRTQYARAARAARSFPQLFLHEPTFHTATGAVLTHSTTFTRSYV